MAIGKLREAAGKRTVRPIATITVQGEELRFREPRTTDPSECKDLMQRLQDTFPGMEDGAAGMVAILTRCYLPGEGEQGVDVLMEFGQLAADNDFVFMDVMAEFGKAFPEYVDWLGAKAAAKNGSREPNEPPSMSPGGTDGSPKN